jgi:competence protein ComEA
MARQHSKDTTTRHSPRGPTAGTFAGSVGESGVSSGGTPQERALAAQAVWARRVRAGQPGTFPGTRHGPFPALGSGLLPISDGPAHPLETAARDAVGGDGAGESDEGGPVAPAEPDAPPESGRSLVRWVVSVRAVVVVLAMLAVSLGVLWTQSAGVHFASAQLATEDPPKVVVPPLGQASSGGSENETNPNASERPSPGAAGSAPVAVSSPSAAAGDRPSVVLHVVGRVKNPGVVTLPSGSRVLQAVAAAGGALPDAALQAINLAAVAVDGQQILVPSTAEVAAGTVPVPAANAGTPGSGSGTGVAPGTAVGGPVNVNTATADELTRLPRIGPVLAQRIVQWRTDHGKFASLDQLDAVPGIGSKMIESLRGLVAF